MSPHVFPEHEAERDRQLVQFPGSVVIGSFRTGEQVEKVRGRTPKGHLLTTVVFADMSRLALYTPWRHYPRRSAGSRENTINVVGNSPYWLDCEVSADDQLRHTDEEMKAQRARLEAVAIRRAVA